MGVVTMAYARLAKSLIFRLVVSFAYCILSEAIKANGGTRTRFRQRVRRTGTFSGGAGGAGFVNAGLHLEPWEIALIVGGVGCCILIVLCMCCKTKKKKAQEQQEYKAVSEGEESIQLQDRPTNCSERRDSYPQTPGYHTLKHAGPEQDEEETTSCSRLSTAGAPDNVSRPGYTKFHHSNGSVLKDQGAQSDFADVTFSKEGQPTIVINSAKLPYPLTPTEVDLPPPLSVQPHLAAKKNAEELSEDGGQDCRTPLNGPIVDGEITHPSAPPPDVPPPDYADVVHSAESEPFIRDRSNTPPNIQRP
ncbi:uncharacterized protein [Ptychodera flava]|uniref:uncharacterized protein n=1 Tax=Ptychodera flava TaxID=63121 RepID=UPI00396A5E0F